MRPGDPRDMLEVAPEPKKMPRILITKKPPPPALGERRYEPLYLTGGNRRRAAACLLAAFAVGLAAGLLISDLRAAPRPAPQLGIPVLAEGRTGAPQYPVPSAAERSVKVADASTDAPSRSGLEKHGAPPLLRSGIASYYDAGRGLYAALPGPWRSGRLVAVCAYVGGIARCATAPVVTSCLCTGPPRKIIDLSPALMERITGWTAAERRLHGVVRVTLEVLR